MALYPPVRTLVGTQFTDPMLVSLVAGASYNTDRYPLTNLVDGTSKTAWRSTDKVVALRFDLGYAANVNFVGVIGHNFTVGTLCSIHATGSPASLVLPPFPPDDEYQAGWYEDQVLNRLFSTRYPNCWVDVRNADGTPTAARYWQLHVIDNQRPVTISEVVIGLAAEFDGIISGLPYAATHAAQEMREVLEYGQVYRSTSGAILRSMDLSLMLMQEQVAAFHQLYQTASNVGGRMVVVPDSRTNDIWLTEWPSLRETTFEESYLVGTHKLSMVEEMSGAIV